MSCGKVESLLNDWKYVAIVQILILYKSLEHACEREAEELVIVHIIIK
jgi:hypothetical protein